MGQRVVDGAGWIVGTRQLKDGRDSITGRLENAGGNKCGRLGK